MNIKGIAILGLGLVLMAKVILGLFIFSPEQIVNDAKDYLQFGEIILRDGPLPLAQGEIEAFSPPGFPWLLALTIYLTGWNGSIVIVNALLSTITVWIIYKIGQWSLPGTWAVLAAIWAVFYVPYSYFIGSILKESLLHFLVPFGIYLLFKLHKKFNVSLLILLSFVFTYTIHTDERYLVFLPLYLIALIQKNNLQKSLKNCILFLFGILIFSSPWFIRNYQVYERPILITERFQSPLDKKLGIENRLNQRNSNLRDQIISFRDSVMAGYSPQVNSGRKRNVKEAIGEGLIPHDYNFVERFYYNSLGYWSPFRTSGILLGSGWKYKGPRTLTVNILYTLNYGLLLPFLLVGIYFAWSQKTRILQWLSLYLLMHYILHVIVIFGSGRYRHPVDFIIIVLAFYGFYSITRLRNWKGIDRLYKQTTQYLQRKSPS